MLSPNDRLSFTLICVRFLSTIFLYNLLNECHNNCYRDRKNAPLHKNKHMSLSMAEYLFEIITCADVSAIYNRYSPEL